MRFHGTRMVSIALALMFAFAALPDPRLRFSTPAISPAQPRSDVPVTAHVWVWGCGTIPPPASAFEVNRIGQAISILYRLYDLPNCPDSTPVVYDLDLGLLPAGWYEAYFNIAGSSRLLIDDSTQFTVATPPSKCVPSATTACALDGRFRVTVRYRDHFDDEAPLNDARVTSASGLSSPTLDTMLFYFQQQENVEVLVKLLDRGNRDDAGRPTVAVLYGVATPLRVEVLVTDTRTNITRRYISGLGASQGGSDFTAFVK